MNKLAALIAIATVSGAATAATVCRIGASGLAFGSYDILTSVPNDSQANLLVTCARDGGPQNITVTMALTEGQYGNSINARKMANTLSPGELLAYGLYTDAGRSKVWGFSTGINTVSHALSVPNKSSAATTFIVYGRVPAQQDVAVGSYSDLVQITVMP